MYFFQLQPVKQKKNNMFGGVYFQKRAYNFFEN